MPAQFVCIDWLDDADLNLLSLIDNGWLSTGREASFSLDFYLSWMFPSYRPPLTSLNGIISQRYWPY